MKIIKSKIVKISVIGLTLFLASCAPPRAQNIDQASQAVSSALGCNDLKSLVFDSFYTLIDSTQTVPATSDMKKSLSAQMSQLKIAKNLSASESATIDQISDALFKVIDLMLEQSPGMTAKSWQEQIQKIIQYEMQNQSTETIIAAHTQINSLLKQVKDLSTELALPCQTNLQTSTSTLQNESAATVLTSGLNRVIATAYQSCHVLDLPAMTSTTPDVVGVTRVGTHADGIGGKREITDLRSVQNTHYYIRGIASESSCLPVRNNPLIYDYGGQASVSGNNLDFFTNAGSGTKALGVDCSAFVSAAVAMSGFRYAPGLPNKAIYTRQGSSAFIDAAASGFTCFENITVSPQKTILAGDIIGVKGHVVAIDRVGKDPFGLALISKESECVNLNYANFDFDIAQSSPSKGGIGINKFKISDYLPGENKMQAAFVGMGKQACLAKFQNKNIKPKNSEWGFVRHKGTAECMAARTTMTGEACAQKCY